MFKETWEKLERWKDAGIAFADKFAVDLASRLYKHLAVRIENREAHVHDDQRELGAEDETYDLDTF